MNCEEYQININQMQIAVKHWHKGQAKTILALHGWLDNANSFDLLAPLLSDYSVVCMDLPGHGRSGHRPEDVPYHLVDYIYDILMLADALGLDDFILMGHSLGGGVGSVLTASFPERVSHLIMLDVLGPLSDDESHILHSIREFVVQRQKMNQKQPPVYNSLEPLVQARFQVGGLSHDSARRLIERALIQQGEHQYTWCSDPRVRVRSPLRLTENQAQMLVQQIQAPTLVLHASHTLDMINTMVEKRQHLITNLTYHQLSGGHHFHMENPQPIAEKINQFLQAN